MKSKSRKFSLKEYLWKRKFGYIPESETTDIKWTTVTTHGVINVPVKILLPAICTQNGNIRVPIEKTPHYKWIKDIVDGNDDTITKEDYRKYSEMFCSNDPYFPWSTEEKLNNIIQTVSMYKSDPGKCKEITIITGPPKWKFSMFAYVVKIYDGVHRASIAMAMGRETIRCRVK